jgi:citronellol/citronellal dehydrogenase
VVRNNLNGGFSMMREVFTQWMRAHGGAIVGVVAPVDFGFPNMGHTGAARAGMINLTQTAALEWVQHGVRVNAVAPGSIIGSGLGTYSAEFQERLKTRRTHIPYHRLGTEAEVSACICFLLSPASTYVTGPGAAGRRRAAPGQAQLDLCPSTRPSRPTTRSGSPRGPSS